MKNSLLIYLLLNISLLYIVAAILTEVRPLRIILKRRVRSVPNQLCLGLIFGLLSISGTYTGMNFQGAVVNTRVVSTVAAGLVGGPLSGLCAGALSGLHRYLFDPSGFTSLPVGWVPLALVSSALCATADSAGVPGGTSPLSPLLLYPNWYNVS